MQIYQYIKHKENIDNYFYIVSNIENYEKREHFTVKYLSDGAKVFISITKNDYEKVDIKKFIKKYVEYII